MFKKLSLKNGIISSIFGISMLATLIGCSSGVSKSTVFNTMFDSNYNVIQLKSSQFEILNDYNDKIEYKNENTCYLNDYENEIFVFATENSSLGINSTYSDKDVLKTIMMYFLDSKMDIISNSSMIVYKENDFTKMFFNNLIVKVDDKEYIGKLSILDYGHNEVFVFVYGNENIDLLNNDYVVKSLNVLNNKEEIIVLDTYPNEMIDSSKITYSEYMNNQNIQVTPTPPPTIEFVEVDEDKVLSNTKTFEGDFYSLNGYYALDKVDEFDDSRWGTAFYASHKNFDFHFKIINAGMVHSNANTYVTNDSKVEYITQFYETNKGINLTTTYNKSELVEYYNSYVAVDILKEYLNQYGLLDVPYSYFNKCTYGTNDWIIIKDFAKQSTVEDYVNHNFVYALTIDDTNAYIVVFVSTPNINSCVEKTLSGLTFKNGNITLSEKNIDMFKELLNVQ